MIKIFTVEMKFADLFVTVACTEDLEYVSAFVNHAHIYPLAKTIHTNASILETYTELFMHITVNTEGRNLDRTCGSQSSSTIILAKTEAKAAHKPDPSE